MTTSLKCFNCDKELHFADRVGLREECSCKSDVHVCKNCSFYDPKVYNECREPQAERVQDRERANRCDYFSPGRHFDSQKLKSDQLRAAAEALFKKK